MVQSACPVCDLAQVPAGAETCPQCDADLTCFAALEALRGPPSTPQPQVRLPPPPPPPPRQLLLAGLAGLGAAVVVGLFALLVWRMWVLDRITEELMLRLPAPAAQAAAVPAGPGGMCTAVEPAAAAPTPEAPPAWSLYRVQPGDTLWRIAGRFYGDGRYYPVILTQNPHLRPNRLTAGDTLRVVADLGDALRLYGEATLRGVGEGASGPNKLSRMQRRGTTAPSPRASSLRAARRGPLTPPAARLRLATDRDRLSRLAATFQPVGASGSGGRACGQRQQHESLEHSFAEGCRVHGAVIPRH